MGQIRGEVVRDGVAQIVLPGLVAQNFERQHRQ